MKNKIMQTVIIIVLLLSSNAVVFARTIVECPDRFLVNRSVEQATLSIQGQIFKLPANVYLDKSRSLMWLGCPIGYGLTATKDSCLLEGSASLDWRSAHIEAQTINSLVPELDAQGLVHTDWRLPNVKELRSLYRHPACQVYVNRSTWGKSIENNDFLNIYALPTVAGDSNIWSSSPVAGNDGMAWSVNLTTGHVQPAAMNQPLRVMLVRDFKLF